MSFFLSGLYKLKFFTKSPRDAREIRFPIEISAVLTSFFFPVDPNENHHCVKVKQTNLGQSKGCRKRKRAQLARPRERHNVFLHADEGILSLAEDQGKYAYKPTQSQRYACTHNSINIYTLASSLCDTCPHALTQDKPFAVHAFP